jgi:hypothetical protein
MVAIASFLNNFKLIIKMNMNDHGKTHGTCSRTPMDALQPQEETYGDYTVVAQTVLPGVHVRGSVIVNSDGSLVLVQDGTNVYLCDAIHEGGLRLVVRTVLPGGWDGCFCFCFARDGLRNADGTVTYTDTVLVAGTRGPLLPSTGAISIITQFTTTGTIIREMALADSEPSPTAIAYSHGMLAILSRNCEHKSVAVYVWRTGVCMWSHRGNKLVVRSWLAPTLFVAPTGLCFTNDGMQLYVIGDCGGLQQYGSLDGIFVQHAGSEQQRLCFKMARRTQSTNVHVCPDDSMLLTGVTSAQKTFAVHITGTTYTSMEGFDVDTDGGDATSCVYSPLLDGLLVVNDGKVVLLTNTTRRSSTP